MQTPLQVSLRNPLNLAMLAVIVVAGLISAWWLVPVGLILWGIMVFNLARSPEMQINQKIQTRAPLAVRFQQPFDRIQRAQVRVFNALSNAPNAVRKALRPLQNEIDRVVEISYRLCLRMTSLENYRAVTGNQNDIENELRHIEDALKLLTDQVIREQYMDSQRSLRDKLDLVKTASRELERLDAYLLSLTAELDSVVAEVASAATLDSSYAREVATTLANRIRQQADELVGYEKEVIQNRLAGMTTKVQ